MDWAIEQARLEALHMQEEVAIEAIQAATQRVFSTMLEKELICEAPHVDPGQSGPSDGVTAHICVVGATSITCLICCSADVARTIAGILLMQECTEVDADVLDAMAEIANMVLGSVKTDLNAHLGDVNLSIPTVTYGQNFIIHNHSKQWVLVPFVMDGLRLMVKVCFEPPYESRRPLSQRKAAI